MAVGPAGSAGAVVEVVGWSGAAVGAVDAAAAVDVPAVEEAEASASFVGSAMAAVRS